MCFPANFGEISKNTFFGEQLQATACDNISLNDKFDDDDPDTIILMRLLAWYIKFTKQKELKKELSEELMPVVWHPHRCWDWCSLEVESKEIGPIFIEEL